MVTRVNQREIDGLPRRNRQIRERVGRDAKLIARLAAQLAPKLTGEGAASIHEEEQPDGSFRVSWDEAHSYLAFSELGTEHQPARPFLRPAAIRFRR